MNTEIHYSQPNVALGKAAPVLIILALAAIIAAKSFVIVEAGHVGVVLTLGAVQDKELPEGFHFRKPFIDQVVPIDIRLARSHAKAIAASKDLQTVTTEVTIQYSLVGPVAPRTYQNIGQRDVVGLTLIEPAIQESVKSVTAKYTAEELVTQRADVKAHIHEAIKNFIDITLEKKKVVNAVNIANVAITDFAFSSEFDRAIELKVKAEQEALQARNEKIRRITQAEAANEERKLAAEAEAFQIEAASVARAEAIEREAKALAGNPDLIKLRTIEKWNGILPKFFGGEPVPFLNLGETLD